MYCQKTETRIDGPWTYGEPGKVGAPYGNKNAEIAAKIRDNDPLELVESGEVSFIHLKAMNYYKDQLQTKRVKLEEKEDLDKCRHLWIFGPPNCGKTWWKDNKIPEPKFEIPRNNDWTGYSGERNLWIDEFKG